MDIDNLTLEELAELHRNICKRIRELHKKNLFEKLQSFEVGDQVSFNHEGKTITGTVIRVNQKSLSVKTKEGARWYVDPRAGVIKIQLPEQEDTGTLYSRIQASFHRLTGSQ